MAAPTTQPGWYADPQSAAAERYWDGSAWTGQSRPARAGTVPETFNGFAVTALVCGLVGLAGVVYFFATWVLDVLAIVFGILGRRRCAANPAMGGRGMATAGVVLGVVALAGVAVLVVLVLR